MLRIACAVASSSVDDETPGGKEYRGESEGAPLLSGIFE
jgi:hypothetical protein